MNDKDYLDYLQDIVDSINETEEFTTGLTFDGFVQDRKTINAVIRSVEVIGEAAKNISQSLRDQYSTIPWKKMTGMRDKLIHEYFGVDLEIIWDTIKKELPLLKPLLLDAIQSLKDKE